MEIVEIMEKAKSFDSVMYKNLGSTHILKSVTVGANYTVYYSLENSTQIIEFTNRTYLFKSSDKKLLATFIYLLLSLSKDEVNKHLVKNLLDNLKCRV